MGILVFVSYATKDSNLFHIPQIAEILSNKPEIDDVLYWEEDMDDDIIKYMNDNVGRCDIFALFCSQDAKNSKPVEMEWQAALKLEKKIIPVFRDEKDIPPLLTAKLGVFFNKSDMEETINSIYNLILKKLKLRKIEGVINKKRITETKKPEIEKRDNGIISFRGAQIPQFEANILQEVQTLTGRKFKYISKGYAITFTTQMGFFVENNQVTRISLYKCGLRTLPESLGYLKWLKELYLHNNKLTILPKSFGELKSLEKLDLRHNQLTTLPESIGNLKLLKLLNLAGNQMTHLPESFGNLDSLESLQMHNNQIKFLPESIGNLKSLKSLTLSRNQLINLPDLISDLNILQSLNLNENKLRIFPKSILGFKSLKDLSLRKNYLTKIPDAISNLTSLEKLYLGDNQISQLPESITKLISLEQLDLSHNKFVSLPESIGELKLLKKLTLNHNPLITLPKSIMNLDRLEQLELFFVPLDLKQKSQTQQIISTLELNGVKIKK